MFKHVFWLAALVFPLWTGCSLLPAGTRRALTPPYKPTNIYLRQTNMPESIRRVAVLPIPANREDTCESAGANLLQPLLVEELTKRNFAEIIPLSGAEVRTLTGRDSWAAEDMLPHDFFEKLRQGIGCDAVLFVRLTAYTPYPPLRTGWKTRLVDCTRCQTWWAVDEIFDAGNDAVASAAEAYARNDLNLPNPLQADTGVLQSPRRFGQYTANAVVRTLPLR